MSDIMTPALGESVTEATVSRWAKKAGEAVKKDELLVELETDKVALEVVAPEDGVLEITAAEDQFSAVLKSARVELPGATRIERFMAAARNPHSSAPCTVASWPDGPGWPASHR